MKTSLVLITGRNLQNHRQTTRTSGAAEVSGAVFTCGQTVASRSCQRVCIVLRSLSTETHTVSIGEGRGGHQPDFAIDVTKIAKCEGRRFVPFGVCEFEVFNHGGTGTF